MKDYSEFADNYIKKWQGYIEGKTNNQEPSKKTRPTGLHGSFKIFNLSNTPIVLSASPGVKIHFPLTNTNNQSGIGEIILDFLGLEVQNIRSGQEERTIHLLEMQVFVPYVQTFYSPIGIPIASIYYGKIHPIIKGDNVYSTRIDYGHSIQNLFHHDVDGIVIQENQRFFDVNRRIILDRNNTILQDGLRHIVFSHTRLGGNWGLDLIGSGIGAVSWFSGFATYVCSGSVYIRNYDNSESILIVDTYRLNPASPFVTFRTR